MRPGQLTPENRSGEKVSNERCAESRFNEAGAINPGKQQQGGELVIPIGSASMRPGQLTPENAASAAACSRFRARFNEAGAINPGKPLSMMSQSFVGEASMRPGQLTPENNSGTAIKRIRRSKLQ